MGGKSEARVKPVADDSNARMDWIDKISAAWAKDYPEVDTSTLSPITRLIRLGVLMDGFQRETLEPYQLTPNDYMVLATLQRAGPPYELSPSDLYTALERSSGGMTKMLKRLEKLGLIRRTPALNDGRSRLVALTDEGFELQDEIFKLFLTRTKGLLQSVSRRQLKEIDDSLRVLLEAIESYFYR